MGPQAEYLPSSLLHRSIWAALARRLIELSALGFLVPLADPVLTFVSSMFAIAAACSPTTNRALGVPVAALAYFAGLLFFVDPLRLGLGLRRLRLRRLRLRALAARLGLRRGLGVRFDLPRAWREWLFFEFRDRALAATTVKQRAPSRSDGAFFCGAMGRLIPHLIRREIRGDDQNNRRSHHRYQSRPSRRLRCSKCDL